MDSLNIKTRIKSFILSSMVSPKNQKIGMEEEVIVYNANNQRLPVNRGKAFLELI